MAILDHNGASISFDSDELIRELKRDLIEFGPNTFTAICVNYNGAKIITNYVFNEDVEETTLDEGEYMDVMNGNELLSYLKLQNESI